MMVSSNLCMMSNIKLINQLYIKYSSQNSRVKSIKVDLSPWEQGRPEINPTEIIERCYRQIFFHAMESDRDVNLESQFKNGSITVRDFVRGLLLSDRFYRGYVACNSNQRIVQQVIGRALGRPVYDVSETISWSILIAEKGFGAFVDAVLDSSEYMDRFNYWSVPEQINRKLPGRDQGELPIYQRLPRYADDWRDRMIDRKMMMSPYEFTLRMMPRSSVDRLIYEKPSGRSRQLWVVFLLIASLSSISIILIIFNAMFEVR